MKTLLFLSIFLLTFFSIGGAQSNPQLSADGKSVRLQVGTASVTITLPKIDNFTAEPPLKLKTFGGLSILQVPYSDIDAATTMVFALDSKGKQLWQKDLATFNACEPLITDKHVFLAGVGHALKVEAKTGKVVWKHTNLYDNPSIQFNGSCEIKKAGELIEFADNLQIRDADGKVLEVKE